MVPRSKGVLAHVWMIPDVWQASHSLSGKIGDHHPRAGMGERMAVVPAEQASGACDDGDAAVEGEAVHRVDPLRLLAETEKSKE